VERMQVFYVTAESARRRQQPVLLETFFPSQMLVCAPESPHCG